MPLSLTLPARINILGNPADAVEGDFATISAAIDCYAGARVDAADAIVLERLRRDAGGFVCEHREELARDAFPHPYTERLDLAKGALNRLYAASAEFRAKVAARGMRLGLWTDVPRQSGLGGSSLLVLLTLTAARAHYALDPRLHNDYWLAELAQRVEEKELGIVCGFADRYVPLFGGIGYLDYHGKLHHNPIGQEPYVTYERLDPWVEGLPLVAVSTGIARDSGDVHGVMRARYMEEHAIWVVSGGEAPPMIEFMRGAWEAAWRGKIALLRGELDIFGEMMNLNHRLVNAMMGYCSFTEGAGWANNHLIDVAHAAGALGAKLTGAGGGGSVFALTRPGEEDLLADAWQQAAADIGLEQAHVFIPRIVHRGLVIDQD